MRDYVDVRDIAGAHLAAADFVGELPRAMNVGTGRRASVREIIGLVLAVTGHRGVKPLEVARRAGDPAFLSADVSLIKSAIGFSSKLTLEESVESFVQ